MRSTQINRNYEIPFSEMSGGVTTKSGNDVSEFTREEVLKSSLEYFEGDELAAEVWMSKYCLKSSEGKYRELNPDDMHLRIARELSRIEQSYVNPLTEEEIFNLIKNFKYVVPQGGPMSGIGNNFQVASLSNCFVIGQNGKSDSYGAIMKTDEEQIQLMKRRGGVGHDLSGIRPEGSLVKNSAVTSTGILPFMNRYSNSTREVAQGGRRGALMLTLSVKHPDILSFINSKQDLTKITGANISVKIDDEFMNAVQENSDYTLQYPVDSSTPIVKKTVKAREIWDLITQNAWNSAEPGVLFWDTILNESVADCYADFGFKTTATNPCGEIPLCPYDSCRLLALNLYSYVDSPFSEKAKFNYKKFKDHCQSAVRIMDDIIDLELEKIDKILKKIESDPEPFHIKQTEVQLWNKVKEKCELGRRTGIGVTAEADMLAALGHTYSSDKAIEISEEIHKIMAVECYKASVHLGKDRGSFPLYSTELEDTNPFIQRLFDEDKELESSMKLFGRRNISLLTIAPTGSTSLMTQTSSGIEPVFNISYMRRKKINPEEENAVVDYIDQSGDSWKEFRVMHHPFKKWLTLNGYELAEVSNKSDEEFNEIIQKSPYHGATTNEVNWRNKVVMQGKIQRWVDHSISVTVNLPHDVKVDLIDELYTLGWKSGCKGITVYRDGSRSGVLVTEKDKEEKSFKRPKELEAHLIRFRNNREKWVAIIGLLDDDPYEIFTGKSEDTLLIPDYVENGWITKVKSSEGKNRYDFRFEDKDGYGVTFEGISRAFNEEYWNYAKLISGIMRHKMPLKYVVDLVANLHLNDESLSTWKNGVVRALSKYIPNGTAPRENQCPECSQAALEYKEGCLTCSNCGHTRCG